MIYSSSIFNAFPFCFNDYNVDLHTYVHILGTLVIRFISPSLFFIRTWHTLLILIFTFSQNPSFYSIINKFYVTLGFTFLKFLSLTINHIVPLLSDNSAKLFAFLEVTQRLSCRYSMNQTHSFI